MERNYEYGQPRRRGRVFTLRLEPKEEETLRARMLAEQKFTSFSYPYDYNRRYGSLGAFIVKHALKSSASIETEADKIAKAKASTGNTRTPAKKKARR